MLSVDCKEKAEMKSALLTADWQLQRPTEKKRGVVEDVAIGRRLAGLRCFRVSALTSNKYSLGD